MAIDPANANPPTNPISFQQIRNEFGDNSTMSLGGYRMNNLDIGGLSEISLDGDGCGILGNGSIPVDNQTIKFSDFYNSRLNVLVDCFTSNQNRVNAKDKYTAPSQAGNYRIIGPRGGDNSNTVDSGPPSNTNGKKIIITVNKQIGSVASSDVTKVALKTGTWSTGTDLRINVRASGLISGAGGNGGNGGYNSTGGSGTGGNSAIGINYTGGTTKIIGVSGAKIQNGFGGGGGGGGNAGQTENGGKPWLYGQGSGGGGGAGIPAGAGGQEPPPDGYPRADGNDGGNGSTLSAGGGGAAGGDIGHGKEGGYIGGGKGGRGADSEQTAQGGNGSEAGGGEWQNGPNYHNGGGAGSNGHAIVKQANTTVDTSGYGGSIIGSTLSNTTPT